MLSQASAGMKRASHRIIALLYNEEQKALDYRRQSSCAIKETEKGAAQMATPLFLYWEVTLSSF